MRLPGSHRIAVLTATVIVFAAAGCSTSGGSDSALKSTTTATSGIESTTPDDETTTTGDEATTTTEPATTNTVDGPSATLPPEPGGAAEAMPTGEDFDVATGTANIDGSTTPTTQARGRPGGRGEVAVLAGTVLDIDAPGPTNWKLTEDPDPKAFELIDSDSIPDGREDPFPESGGATIVTLRALKAGRTTFVLQSTSGSGEKITVNVTVS